MKFSSQIVDYDLLHERLNWLQTQIDELQSKVEVYDSVSSASNTSTYIHHRVINDKTWKLKRRQQFVDARDIKPAAIILTRSILQFLAPGPVSEKDLRVSTANRCKDLGVKITGKGGVAGESMDVFTVCNVLQAIGVLEEATINPPPSTNSQKDANVGASVTPLSPPPSDPTALFSSPNQSFPDITNPESGSVIITPSTAISLLPSDVPERAQIPHSELTNLLRSATPIIPISFDQVGEGLSPIKSLPQLANFSNPKDSVSNSSKKSGQAVDEKTELFPEVHPLLSSISASQTYPVLPLPQSRLTYGAQVESSLTSRWEKQLRDYLKDLRCRKISHIMGRESYHGSSGLNSRVNIGRGGSSGHTSRSVQQQPTHPQLMSHSSHLTQTSLDEEDFEEDDDTTNHSQSTTPPPTPLGIAVPSVTSPNLALQKATPTTPRDSTTAITKISSPGAMLSPSAQVKEKKPVMRRFTGSTRGGWTFPNPTSPPNELNISQYDIFLNPQEVLSKWSQICYDENKAEEIEECLLRQIAAKCGLSLPLEPFRIGTHYLSSDYRVTLTKTRSGSFSQIPGDQLSGNRPRSSSKSSTAGPSKSSKQGSVASQSDLLVACASQPTNTDSSFHSPYVQHLVQDVKKAPLLTGGVYDESSSWTAAALTEKARRNQSNYRGKIFQKKPRFDEASSTYFFSESSPSYLTSPRQSMTPLSHGLHAPVDPPSSRKRSRSGSSQFVLSSTHPTSRPYCPILVLYDSMYRTSDSTNTDQSAGPDVCPVTGRLSLVDIIIDTRPIPWSEMAKQFTTLQIDEHIEFEDVSSNSQSTPIGKNLNGSIGTWVEIPVSHNENDPVDSNDLEESKGNEKRRKKSLLDDNYQDEKRPKRLQRSSSTTSLKNFLNEDDRKNFRHEFRRVSFADVVAPSFREVPNYQDIYCQDSSNLPILLDDEEDLSDTTFAKRHEETLQRMREKWAKIQELKDSLKKSASSTSNTPTDKHSHHFASPRHHSSHKHSKSPGTPKIKKSGSILLQKQISEPLNVESSIESQKKRRGRQKLESPSTIDSAGSSKTRRSRVSSVSETSVLPTLANPKKRKEISETKVFETNLQPRKRGRPPKYHSPSPVSKVIQSKMRAMKTRRGQSGVSRLRSSPSRFSPTDSHQSIGQFPSTSDDDGVTQASDISIDDHSFSGNGLRTLVPIIENANILEELPDESLRVSRRRNLNTPQNTDLNFEDIDLFDDIDDPGMKHGDGDDGGIYEEHDQDEDEEGDENEEEYEESDEYE